MHASSFSHLSASLETIAPQKDKTFPKALEAVMTKFLEAGKAGDWKRKAADVSFRPLCLELEHLVFERFGIAIRLSCTEISAATIPQVYNINHVFFNDMLRGSGFLNTPVQQQKDEVISGSVDLRAARVHGMYSKSVSSVFMNFKTLFDNYELNVGQVCAVFLHEIGHIFHSFEYSDRLSTTNQVLQSVAQSLKSDSPAKLEHVYKDLRILNQEVTREEAEKLVNGEGLVPSAMWFKVMVESVKTQLVHTKYSETSFEALADSFASRMGFGKELTSALWTLHNESWDPDALSLGWVLVALEDLRKALILVSLFAGTIVSGSFLPAFVAGVMFGVLRITLGNDTRDMTYDDLQQRLKRARSEIVAFLKDETLDQQSRNEILVQLGQIDAVMEKTHDFKSMMAVFFNTVFPSARRATKAIEYEKLMEALAGNELFVKAASIKSLA